MISALDLYHVLTAVVPLYVAMILAYGSVKWWKIFSPDQCSGINRFVALFAVPLLSFHFISSNNPYAMNFRFIAADTLQKIMVLVVLTIWTRTSSRGCLEWTITLFSLSSLPNTLVMGIPLLKGMYGPDTGSLMVQIVVLQCIIWYTLMLFLFEYRGAKLLIAEQFPGTAGSIISFKVDSDVISLDGKEPLQTEAEVGEDGKLHVTVRKSTSSRSEIFSRRSHGLNSGISLTPRPSNLTNAEIYSLQSSRNPTPRGSSFNHNDLYSMVNGRNVSNVSPRQSNFGNVEERANYPPPSSAGVFSPAVAPGPKKKVNGNEGGKDLHMFVWSSSASPVSEGGIHVLRGGGGEYGSEQYGGVALSSDQHLPKEARHDAYEKYCRDDFSFGNKAVPPVGESIHKDLDSPSLSRLGPSSTAELHPKTGVHGEAKPTSMPPASVMTRLILIMVWRKLIRNPNTYSSLIGLVWSLVSFRWGIEMPALIAKSISLLSDAGLGMAMFSLGLFMALQPRIIACGNSIAAFAMAVRFITGPAVMAAASIAVGLRGVLLHIAIVQTDKASLLARVVQHVKDLKQRTSEIAGSDLLPTETDEIDVFFDEVSAGGRSVFKASVCCEDRSDLLPDLIETLKSLRLRTIKAEMATLGGRVRNVLVVAGEDDYFQGDDSVGFLREALKALVERAADSERGKRRRVFDRRRTTD